jgi:hypothetical protein
MTGLVSMRKQFYDRNGADCNLAKVRALKTKNLLDYDIGEL